MLDIYNQNNVGKLINVYSPAEAHRKALQEIAKNGKIVTVIAGGKPVRTKEILFMNLLIANPLDKTIPPKTEWTSEAAISEYAEKEILGKVIPEGFTYTYGSELQEPVDQISRVVKMLKEDPSSRKATMVIGGPGRLFEQDPPCCKIVDLKDRGGRVNMSLVFRSHDYGSGLYPNLRGFAMLQERIAGQLRRPVGWMSCTSFSAHVYENDWHKLED